MISRPNEIAVNNDINYNCFLLQINGNVFQNNTGLGAILINATSQSVCRSCEIEDNVFINNTKRATSRQEHMETIRLVGRFHLSLKNNYFDNPNADFEVTMPSNDNETTDASGCYWGELSYTNITHR